MITSLQFVPITGSTINLNTDPPGYPVTAWDTTVIDRIDDSRNRMEKQGVYPTFPYEGGMEIHCEGDIIGTSSDDYNARRRALVSAWRFPNGPTQRKHGTINVLFDGETEHWLADVVVRLFTAPRGGLSPAISHFTVTFFSWLPYYIGAISGNPYYEA